MKFFKENSSVIARLIITHIGMSVFGLVIFLATNQQGDNIMLIASIASLLFYGVIAYTTMWEYGSKDKPAIDAGRLDYKPSNAFLLALVAELVGVIIILVYLISSFYIDAFETAKQIYAISYLVLYVVQSCASGFMLFFHHLYENALINSLCLMISPLLICICSMAGYALGAKGIHILPEKKINKK